MLGPCIEVLLDNAQITPVLQEALEQIDAEVRVAILGDNQRHEDKKPVDARILLTGENGTVTGGKLDQLFVHFDQDPCATLVLSSGPVDPGLMDRATTGRAIGFANSLSRDDLIGRLAAMVGMREPMDALRHQLDEFRQREAALTQSLGHLEQQVRTACRLQRNLIASPIPNLKGIDIEVLFKPLDVSSGDLYNVARLDDSNIGVSLADATGHGLPAAFLSTYAKQWLCGWEPISQGEQPAGPVDVLTRLNEAVLSSALTECEFLATLHAVYDESSRRLCWARGGMPYPVLVRPGEPPVAFHSEGPLVGVVPNARFEVVELTLKPGDRVIFHTDGLAALLMRQEAGRCCCDLSGCDWFQSCGEGMLDEKMLALKDRLETTPRDAWDADDVTVVVVEAL